MTPERFIRLADKYGSVEKYPSGEVFHTQNFPNKLFLLKTGYVKRYQATKIEQKVLELIYGPGNIISLSQLYKMCFGIDQNQDNFIYIYQTMTNVELVGIDADVVFKELEKDPLLYRDFFFESGLRLRSNISRLASNSIKDDYKKVAHHIVSISYEFGGFNPGETKKNITLPLPQSASDIAEQLNISVEITDAILNSLKNSNLIELNGSIITIADIDLLKDIYL